MICEPLPNVFRLPNAFIDRKMRLAYQMRLASPMRLAYQMRLAYIDVNRFFMDSLAYRMRFLLSGEFVAMETSSFTPSVIIRQLGSGVSAKPCAFPFWLHGSSIRYYLPSRCLSLMFTFRSELALASITSIYNV